MGKSIIAVTTALLLCASVAWGRMGLMVVGGTPAVTAANPTYEGLIGTSTTVSDSSTTVITTTAGASSGGRVVVAATLSVAGGQNISGVSDSAGNTYSSDVSRTIGSNQAIQIWSAQVTSALNSGGTITVSWSSPSYSYRTISSSYISNSTGGVDSTATGGSAFGTTVSVSASTSATNTAIVGAIYSTDSSKTYSGTTWGASSLTQDNTPFYTVSNAFTSSGTKDPGGAWSTNCTWGGIWAAYK